MHQTEPKHLPAFVPVGALVLSLTLSWMEGLACLGVAVHSLLLWRAGGERGVLLRHLALAWVFISLGCLPLAISFNASEGLPSLLGVGLSREGVRMAGVVFLRASTAFASLQLLWQIIPFYELCRRMRRIGIPSLLIDLFELSYRYVFILQETTEHIREAQLSRLGYSNGYRRSLGEIRLLATQTFVLSMSEADLSYDGLLSRGFDEDEASAPSLGGGQTPEGTPILSLEGISYQYTSGRQALSGVSLSIHKGERIALLGENGAGKSTLMRLLSGIASKQGGRIVLSGEEISTSHKDMKRLRSRVSLVFQNSNYQLFCPSVEDEIAFGLRNIGLDEQAIAERIREIIKQFDLEDLRHLPPHKLSEGQKKWVSLAAIIAIDPEVLLLDEPTASLDRGYTRRVMNLLERLHREGKTIILSTHDMDLAYQWAGRVLVMHKGALIADATVDEVFEDLSVLERANLEPPLRLSLSPLGQGKQRRAEVEGGTSQDFSLALYHKASTLRALIVGGGRGALRKAQTLIASGVHTTVVAPEIAPELRSLLQEHNQSLEERLLKQGEDLSAYDILIGATGQTEIENYLCTRGQALGRLYCTLSDPSRGNIQFPAQGTKEGIQIALRSQYALPELTREMRDGFLEQIPESFASELEHLSQLRARGKETQSEEDKRHYSEARDQILNRLRQ